MYSTISSLRSSSTATSLQSENSSSEFLDALAQGNVARMEAAIPLHDIPIDLLARSLCRAMRQGHALAINTLNRSLASSMLSPEAWKILIQTKDENGVLGLASATENDDYSTILAVGNMLFSSSLDAADCKETLQVLRHAVANHCRKAVKAIGMILVESEAQKRMEPGDRSELLQMDIEEGIPSLPFAINSGDAAMVKTLGETYAQIRLSPMDLKNILVGKHISLRPAYELGHAAALEAYSDLVIALQGNEKTRLKGKEAEEVLAYMRDAHYPSKTSKIYARISQEEEHDALFSKIRTAWQSLESYT